MLRLASSFSEQSGFPNSVQYEFEWDVVCPETRTSAAAIITEVRPHSLLQDKFTVIYITDSQDAKSLADRLMYEVDLPVGFDFETSNWRPISIRESILGGAVKTRGLSPAHPELQALPVTFQISWGLDTYVVLGKFLYLFKVWVESDAKIDYANESFEAAVFHNVGIRMPRAHRDCIAMDFLLEETLRQRSHGLKALCKDYLGVVMADFESVFKGQEFSEVLQADPDNALRYAGLDALVTTLVCDVLAFYLSQRSARENYNSYELYLRWERAFHSSIRRIETTGIPLSREILSSRHDELSARVEEIDGRAYQITGKVINLSSNKELCSWYYDTCSKPVALTTSGFTCILCDRLVTKRTNYKCPLHGRGALVNSPSVNDEVLEQFASDGDELAQLLQSRRTVEKKRTTWIDGFYRLSTSEDWGYPTIRSTYVVSGRLSAGIWLTTPGDLRDIFAFRESDPRVFIRLDYSQLELRLLAHESGDSNMLQAFSTGKDLHCWTAGLLVLLRERGEEALEDDTLKELYYQQVLEAKVAADSRAALDARGTELLNYRQIAKTVNFGIAYGMGADKFARQQGTTIEEANAIFSAVWAMYSQVEEYFENSIKSATESGEIRTLLGRNRKIPELASSSPGQRGYGERLVKNSPCQAGGADVIRAAMILVDMDIEAGGGYGTQGRGCYGDWDDGGWRPDYNFLPKGWQNNLPLSFQSNPGLLGRLGFRMCLQVHDELLFFGPEEHAEEAGNRVKELMENPFGADLEFSAPLKVTVGTGKSWDEAK